MFWLAFALTFAQVTGVVQRADPTLKRVEILRRAPIGDTFDAVVIFGDKQKLGLLLQNRADPSLVYLLGIEAAPTGCAPRVERIAETEVIGSCGLEKYQAKSNWKFLFDPRAKALVRFFTYEPFVFDRVYLRNGGAVFPASNGERAFDVEYPAFRLLAAPLKERSVSSKPPAPYIPLPKTTYDQFAELRPQAVKWGNVRNGTHVNDTIGPWKKLDGAIWFGKSFYDGEGETGVGGFGYYDPETKKLKVYSPPEILAYSVSAMLFGPTDIWMGLASFGEGDNMSGGLLRFDRQTETVQKVPLIDVPLALERLGERILVATDVGIAVVENGQVHRYFIDRMGDGRWRVVEAN